MKVERTKTTAYVRRVIVERFMAGESVRSLAKDYGLTQGDVAEIIRHGTKRRP